MARLNKAVSKVELFVQETTHEPLFAYAGDRACSAYRNRGIRYKRLCHGPIGCGQRRKRCTRNVRTGGTRRRGDASRIDAVVDSRDLGGRARIGIVG